jgi:hypothetical protein
MHTNSAAALLRATAAALRLQADGLEAQATALETESADEWLDLHTAAQQGPVSADTLRRWAKSGRLRACQAERGRLVFRRSWLDQAIEATPYVPKSTERDDAEPANDPFAAGLTGGRLRAIGGGQ